MKVINRTFENGFESQCIHNLPIQNELHKLNRWGVGLQSMNYKKFEMNVDRVKEVIYLNYFTGLYITISSYKEIIEEKN